MKKQQIGFKSATLALVLACSLSPGLVLAASCEAQLEDIKGRLGNFSKKVDDAEKTTKDEHSKTTSSNYSKNYFKTFEDLNKNAKEAHQLVNTAYELTGFTKPLAEGEIQKKLPPKVTHTMGNAVELSQAAMKEENSKLDLALLRCNQSTEDTALSAYLNHVGGGAVSNYKSTKKTACKLVHVLADLQDKRQKLNDFRQNGYPLFFLHAKEKRSFNGLTRTIQLKADLRMYPQYPAKPVNSTKLNGQPILLGQLESIDLSYNSYFKWSDNKWTDLNLFQYLVSDTNKGEVCPTTIKITSSVRVRLCVSVEDIKNDKIKLQVRARYNYNDNWSAVSLGTHTIPAPFGYLADISDMKEKKMEDLKSKLANRVISLMGDYGEMIEKAQQWN
jgi:hypothetical protein